MWWAKIKWIQKPKWDQSEINNTNTIRWRKIPTFIKVFNMSCHFNAVDDKRVATLQYNLKNCIPTKWSLTGQENLRTTSLLSGAAWQRKIKWQQQTSKLNPREKVPRLNTVPQPTKYASWITLPTRCYCIQMYLNSAVPQSLNSSFHTWVLGFHHFHFCLTLQVIVQSYQAVLVSKRINCCLGFWTDHSVDTTNW